jgi:DNA-binding NarL/FixJ family response regulator
MRNMSPFFCNVVAATAETAETVALLLQRRVSSYMEQPALCRRVVDLCARGDRSEPSRLTESRESACPPGCRVCFLAEIYGLTPREVALIALISSGKSGRAISQTLGVGMPKIRQYCSRIHSKIGTCSRLGIGLWAIRKGMVKSAVVFGVLPFR